MTNHRKSVLGTNQASQRPETKADAGRVKGGTSGASKSGKKKGGSARAAPDYDVGYGRPPRHTQFQKGQPRPPRKPKPEVEPSFQDFFEEELRQPMKFVDETGKEQVMPKGQVLAKASVNKALKSGDIRQIKDFIPRRPAKTDNEVATADIELIARFLAHKFGIGPIPGEDEQDGEPNNCDGDESAEDGQ